MNKKSDKIYVLGPIGDWSLSSIAVRAGMGFFLGLLLDLSLFMMVLNNGGAYAFESGWLSKTMWALPFALAVVCICFLEKIGQFLNYIKKGHSNSKF